MAFGVGLVRYSRWLARDEEQFLIAFVAGVIRSPSAPDDWRWPEVRGFGDVLGLRDSRRGGYRGSLPVRGGLPSHRANPMPWGFIRA